MYRGPIIDSDLHHTWTSSAELMEFLPLKWREYFGNPSFGGAKKSHREFKFDHALPVQPFFPPQLGTNKRTETFPPGGAPAGSDYELMRKQYLDPLKITRAVLGYDTGIESGIANPYLASAAVSAANDWSLARWLDRRDARLHGALLVPTQIPEDGAAEIHRLGKDPRMVEVRIIVNGVGKPFGHPLYHPIYKAAAEMGLPVVLHLGGDSSTPTGHTAGGQTCSRLEYHTLAAQPVFEHIASFIVHGVFEKYPGLKVGIVEYGFAWVPWLMWSLDAHYEILRTESSWVRKRPSDYIREHMVFSTQPLDEGRGPNELAELLSSVEGLDDLLLFATDYPHWDSDEPLFVQRYIPEAWHEKMFYRNAQRFYRWPSDVLPELPTLGTH